MSVGNQLFTVTHETGRVGTSLGSELLLKIEFDVGLAHEDDEIPLPLGQSHCGLLYL